MPSKAPKLNAILKLDKTHPGAVILVANNFIWLKGARTGGSSMMHGILKPCFPNLLHRRSKRRTEFKSYLKNLNEDKINGHFLFTFVRNPWERVVSLYFYFRNNKTQSFSEFVSSISQLREKNENFRRHSVPLHLYAYYEGTQFVDFVGRFENLQQDFDYICRKIGIPPKKLPRISKTNHKSYEDYYTEETMKLVAQEFQKDIEYFGYEFGK